MANVKQPQDRKPKADGPKYETVEITVGDGDDERTIPARRVEIRGIEMTVSEEAMRDFEILDDIRAAQDERDMSRMPSILRRLVGVDEYRRAMDGLRGPHGRVDMEDGAGFVMELFGALNPNS